MIHYFDWNDNNIIWNSNPYLWNAVYEITVEVSINRNRGVAFSKIKKKYEYTQRPINDKKQINRDKSEEKRYIKILCIINDEKFEDIKYINKKLKIESFDEEFTIKEIKKVNISQEDVKYEIFNKEKDKEIILELDNKRINKKVNIEVKNIKIT